MKHLIFLLLFLPIAVVVGLTGLITDDADILTASDEEVILQVLQNIKDSGKAEFAIVTIQSLEGQDIESYSLSIAQDTIGDKEKNNGLLLLIAVDDREYRFEVGRGLEATLPDSVTGRIGRTYLVDNFRNGDYAQGIYESSLAISELLEVNQEVTQAQKKDFSRNSIITFLIFMFIFSMIMSSFSKRSSSNRYFNAALMAATLFRPRFRGGGGFGGFGGGGFGGGGAGGKW